MKLDADTIGKLGASTVLDENGKAVALAQLWKDRRAIVLFVRHFG